MVWLSDVAAARDNNLNLIRVIAAAAVLVSHAFPMALGNGAPEPLEHLTGYSLGGLAVLVFFVISGVLITGSYENSNSRTRFVVARALRLVPGLFVCMVLSAFLLGPLVTQLSISTYLTIYDPYIFVANNTLLFQPIFQLPGVFTDNPLRNAAAGSIWTLP